MVIELRCVHQLKARLARPFGAAEEEVALVKHTESLKLLRVRQFRPVWVESLVYGFIQRGRRCH